MTTSPGPPQSGPAEKPTVYRGPGAVFGGAIVFLFCLGGGLDLLAEEGTVDLVGVSVMFLVASLAFAYGIYPAAYCGPEALVVRNPLRSISLSWGIVTKLTAQLSFIAFTTADRYTVWAVPVSIRDRRKAERARLRDVARQSRGDRQGSGGAFTFGAARSSTRSSDIDRLSYADQALTEMGARREAWCDRNGIDPGLESTSTEPPVISWNVATLAPIAACVLFVIISAIVR
jgi:hypothetical protein